ncbi:MAG TPA: hypothetical protein VEJ84_03385 [Acidimicrobiales bacterium]|nr:hypothetical protein [Acidimicrobiales bacterium]
MAPGAIARAGRLKVKSVQVTLLGPFAMSADGRRVGPWYRPSAKRLCELLMVSPARRLRKEAARELLFAHLNPGASANALSRALSLARDALAPLGEGGANLLRADRANIWVAEEAALDIDLVSHERGLRSALGLGPGERRDALLQTVLRQDGVLLEDEPYADWAIRPREVLDLLRQRARLELARDRDRGYGRSEPAAVIEAWEDCLEHDPASEEAASSLVRIYLAEGSRQLASSAYERCRAAL